MKKISIKYLSLICGALVLSCGVQMAQAAVTSYNITTTWYEPMTQPNDSIFKGTFDYDSVTHTVSNLKGILSESMTGNFSTGYPNDTMTWVSLNNQLVSWHDATLGGTFAATFRNTNTNTFATSLTPDFGPIITTDGWSPQAGVDVGGVHYGFPVEANNPENAYALIFVPDSLGVTNSSTLAWNETTGTGSLALAYTSYADFTLYGMMGAVGMTGTSAYAYGGDGTMGGVPAAQVITATPIPAAAWLLGSGLLGLVGVRRKKEVQK